MTEAIEASNGVSTPETVAAQPTPEQIQISEFERMAFGGEKIISQEPISAPSTETPPTAATEITPATPAEQVLDASEFLKTNFGWESIEAAQAELNKLRAAPTSTAAEIAFANEESKKLHQLLKEGKTKEVRNYLEAQELMTGLDTMADEQKLKLYIKMQNPKFDSELIDDEYNTFYKLNEDDYLDDPMKLRKERLRMEQRKENDIQKANDYFSTYKQKIELPDILPQQSVVNSDYEDYKASTAKSLEDYNNITVPGINSLKETDIQLKASINDANNQMQFDVSVVPEREDFEKARQNSLSVFDYLTKTCYDQSGKFLPDRLARLVLLNDNFDKYAQSIARQAVNAERKRVIATDTRSNGGVQRDFNTTPVEQTELQKFEKMAFG